MTGVSDTRKLLLDCTKLMLRPVLKFCLRHSIHLPDLLECCKVVFLELASEQIEKSGETVSISRLSVMSGITRREVTRLHREKREKDTPLSLPTKVLGQWQNDRRFITQNGQPRVLSNEGRDSEFNHLVRLVSADLNAYTVLYELERIGAVERTPKGIKLAKLVYGNADDMKGAAKMMALDASDLMAAIEENTAREEGQAPNFHIVTEYDNISKDAVPKLKRWVVKQGADFHKKLRNYFSQFDKDLNPDLADAEGGVRVVFGGFSRVVINQK